jgi:hypothetical protein
MECQKAFHDFLFQVLSKLRDKKLPAKIVFFFRSSNFCKSSTVGLSLFQFFHGRKSAQKRFFRFVLMGVFFDFLKKMEYKYGV